MVSRIFQLLVLFSPISVGTNIGMDMFDIQFFRTGIIALFAGALLDKPKRDMPKELREIIFALLGVVLINLFIHTFAPVVLHTSMNLFLAIVGFCVVYIHWDERLSLKAPIFIAVGINLAFFLGQKMGFDPVWDILPYKGQEGAFLGNQPRLMTYFSLVTSLLPLYLLPISVALGIFTKQNIIFIPVIITLILRVKSTKAKIVIGCCFIIAVLFLYKSVIASLLFRFNLAWMPALKLFFDRPLLGYGLGAAPVDGVEVLGNSYLQLAMGMGLLGLAWYGYLFKTFYKYILTSSALLSLALIMTIEYPVEIMRLGYLVIAILISGLIKRGVAI